MVWNQFPKVFFRLMVRNKFRSVFLFLKMVMNKITKFVVFLYFTKWFRVGIPSIFYFFRIVQKKNTKYQVFLCFFSSIKWFKQNSEQFLFSANWLGMEFRVFSFPRNRRNSDGRNQNIRLFRGIIFSGKMATLVQKVTARRGEFWRLNLKIKIMTL